MADAPRILALIGSRVLYGQERANLLLLENLKADGCEILAVVEDHPAFRIMPEQLTQRGITYCEIPYIGRREPGYLKDFLIGNPVRLFSLKRRLKKIIKEFQPTHIHVANPFAFLMASVSATPHIPIIYRIGDNPETHNTFWRWLWRRIASRVNHFVADSEFIANQVEKIGVSRNQISVIYSAPPRRIQLPHPDRAPDSPGHIAFIGQIGPHKGVDRLIDAFRAIIPEFPGARLTIAGRISESAGDAWARALREATVSDQTLGERVHFAGEIEDIYELLASCAFLVVPSVWNEPFGIVCVEAKAAARPAVVFPRGGMPEQFIHGVDGFICADTSVDSLAEGLRYYLCDPSRAVMHGQAALVSLERLRIDDFASRVREIYRLTWPISRRALPKTPST